MRGRAKKPSEMDTRYKALALFYSLVASPRTALHRNACSSAFRFRELTPFSVLGLYLESQDYEPHINAYHCGSYHGRYSVA